MKDAVLEITVLFIFASPFIALVLINAYKNYRKFRPAKPNASVEAQTGGIQGEPSLPPKPANPRRAALMFIGISLLVILYGVMTGLVLGAFSQLIYIVFVFPLVMGINGGKLIVDVIQRAKVRKTSQLIFFSLLSAVVMYGTFHYCRYVGLQLQMSLKISPGLSQALDEKNFGVAKVLVDSVLEEETGYSGFIGYMLYRASEGVSIGRLFRSSSLKLGPVLTWLYWLAEFGIILGVTIQMGKQRRLTPFCECEACGNRYGDEKHLGGTTRANETLLLDLIKQKDFGGMGQLMESNADLPSLEVYFQGCQVCSQSHSHLLLRHAFLSSGGKVHFSDASKIILQPEESGLLLSQLKFTGTS